jgi:hypothetical protein
VVWANRKEGQGGGSESTRKQAVEGNGPFTCHELPIRQYTTSTTWRKFENYKKRVVPLQASQVKWAEGKQLVSTVVSNNVLI